MNRSLWTQTLTEKLSPAWPCPYCRKGVLNLAPSSLISKETIGSKRAREDEAWEPEWTTYVFIAWLKCSYANCSGEVAVTGKGFVRCYDIWDEEAQVAEMKCTDYFKPLFCWPMPDIFELPEKCPAGVRTELHAAFQLFWADQSASAGRVRVSLERLMDYYKIPKRRKGKDGKYFDLILHGRIEIFSQKQSATGEKLMALKWLGNTASHQGDVSLDDLLDGFEILEYLLAELFAKRSIRVTELARQLTKKHSVRRRKKRSPKVSDIF